MTSEKVTENFDTIQPKFRQKEVFILTCCWDHKHCVPRLADNFLARNMGWGPQGCNKT